MSPNPPISSAGVSTNPLMRRTQDGPGFPSPPGRNTIKWFGRPEAYYWFPGMPIWQVEFHPSSSPPLL